MLSSWGRGVGVATALVTGIVVHVSTPSASPVLLSALGLAVFLLLLLPATLGSLNCLEDLFIFGLSLFLLVNEIVAGRMGWQDHPSGRLLLLQSDRSGH